MRILPLLALALLLACGSDDEPPPDYASVQRFERGTALVVTRADSLRLSVEIAETEQQRAHGLMERAHLDADAGMVFLYDEPQEPTSAFYMFRTRIPLDIAFFDGEGAIVRILTMEPCESPNPAVCRLYSPGVSYQGALEANAGFFERRGVVEGDRVVVERGAAEQG